MLKPVEFKMPPQVEKMRSEGEIDGVLYYLEYVLGKIFSIGSKEYYDNISSSYAKFCKGLKEIKKFNKQRGKNHKLKFLDVGCGLGIKPLLAKFANFESYGIDLNPDYCAIATSLGIEVECVNALEYQKYNLFDVIYWYLPIKKPLKEFDLELKIFKEANSGAILYPICSYLPVYGCFDHWTGETREGYNPTDDGWCIHEWETGTHSLGNTVSRFFYKT